VSILAGLFLALADFGASALLSAISARKDAATSVGIVLAGFIARLSIVAVAMFVLVRFLQLSALPLGAALAGGFTALALGTLLVQWRGMRLG